jgi:hypothetical protein
VVAEVYDAVVESVLVEELEVGADARGQGRFAAAVVLTDGAAMTLRPPSGRHSMR